MFSDKYTKKEKQILQIDSITEKLKIDIWNTIQKHFFNLIYYNAKYSAIYNYYSDLPLQSCCNYSLIIDLYENFFIHTIGNMRSYSLKSVKNNIEQIYAKMDWANIYDLIEYISTKIRVNKKEFENEINMKLERNNSAYRLIEDNICPITNDLEISNIKEASHTMYDVVNVHIDKAIQLFSNKNNPDYENTIKESIVAIETLCSIIVGKKSTLGDALKKLEDNGISIHPALKASFDKLYGYTSDANGIRHAGDIGGKNSTFSEAKFMLVSCSAFINYLIDNYANISN